MFLSRFEWWHWQLNDTHWLLLVSGGDNRLGPVSGLKEREPEVKESAVMMSGEAMKV